MYVDPYKEFDCFFQKTGQKIRPATKTKIAKKEGRSFLFFVIEMWQVCKKSNHPESLEDE